MFAIVAKVSVILLFTTIAAFTVRRSSAAVRHAVWVAGLLAALALPLASRTLPEWSVMTSPSVVALFFTEFKAVPSFAGAGGDVNASKITGAWSMLRLVWSVGALSVLARIVLGEFALVSWKRRAHPVRSSEWLRTIAANTGRRRQRSSITFLECDTISTPCTWGTIQPTILLPASGAHWSEDRRRGALIHELAHVRRLDAATTLLGRITCALHWYNPLVWMAARSARRAQEEACDDAVLAEHVVPTDYAALLIELCNAGTQRGDNMATALGLSRKTGTETRVRSVLDAARRRTPVSCRMLAGVVTFGIAALVSIATVAPAQNRPVAQVTPDSATMAQMVKRICESRSASSDTNTVANFTVRGRLTQGPDTLARRMVEYTVSIKGCGRQGK